MTLNEVKNLLAEHVAKSGFDNRLKFDCGADGVLLIDKTDL